MSDALVQSFQETFGAAIIGGFLAMALFGLATSQTYFYFVEYPKDETWRKCLVCTLWVLNTVHSALIFHMAYHYLILNAFNPFGLSQNVCLTKTSMIVHIITAFLVMIYFLSIIFQFSTPKLRWWLAIPNAAAIFLHVGFGTESTIHVFQTPTLVHLTAYTKMSFLPMAATQVVADVLIAVSLSLVLHGHRTAFRKTNSIVDTLIVYAINRCLLTAGTAIVSLFLIILKPDTMMYIGPEVLFAGLYTNALLATLNSRHRIRDGGSRNDASNFSSVHLSNVHSDTLTASDSHTHRRFASCKVDDAKPTSLIYDGSFKSMDEGEAV
ncbi:hypothetical protein K438DRAFT_725807 [Mycena galopus ATCC 62051]|nr:hypothetical protein K438DRAFT_725807 [Mycena galopus ATCC 62051]